MISWSWSYLISWSYLLMLSWSYLIWQMILCFHTFLRHVLDAYFGYYLHALDMCYTWLTPAIHFQLSWSMLGHVLSKEQSKDGSWWWPPHHCSVPPLPPATFIRLISELCRNTSSTLLPPTKPAFLSLSLPTSTMCYLPQHNQSPTMLYTCSMFQANHIAHAPVLEVMSLGHHKDLQGFKSASFGTLWSTSLFIICSFYYHMLSKLTPYMFMFLLCINTPVCCMYFASSNINLATYFS